MDFNPHSLNQILIRIREQMRCPQCGSGVSVDFPSIKLAGENFMILELKCEACMSFIVLHVNLLEKGKEEPKNADIVRSMNASSTVALNESEMKTLRTALKKYDGSFEKMFQAHGGKS